ncbi:MAG: ribokinase [Thermoproteota archaeon]|nr:ribokinase [Thermoproteota archaeon]
MPKILVCGAINWDTTLFVERFPDPGEEVHAIKVISVPGGKGANMAVAAAKILGASNVTIIGMLGVDSIAESQIKILQNDGIDTSLIFRHNGMLSGQAYVIVDSKGENMILSYQAANLAMTPEDVSRQNVLSAIYNSNTVIVIDPPLDTAGSLIISARRAGKRIIWSPALLTRYGLSIVQKYAAHVDYLILNQQEARTLTLMDDGVQACSKISNSLGGRNAVVVTLGDEGCVLCNKGKSMIIPPLDLASSPNLKIVSTVGAGDTFVGTFGAFKLNGFEDTQALYLANIAAALKTTQEDTRGSPTFEDIKSYAYEMERKRGSL